MSVIKEALKVKIAGIRLMIFDVDGVLTVSRIVLREHVVEAKLFDVRDGHGIKMLMRSGVEIAIITARQSRVVEHRAANLGIELVYQGARDKLKAFDEILDRLKLAPDQAAYMGDDIIDLPVMKRTGFSATVPDAAEEVRERADYVAVKPGGGGAAREVCELILKAQDKWEEALSPYLR